MIDVAACTPSSWASTTGHARRLLSTDAARDGEATESPLDRRSWCRRRRSR